MAKAVEPDWRTSNVWRDLLVALLIGAAFVCSVVMFCWALWIQGRPTHAQLDYKAPPMHAYIGLTEPTRMLWLTLLPWAGALLFILGALVDQRRFSLRTVCVLLLVTAGLACVPSLIVKQKPNYKIVFTGADWHTYPATQFDPARDLAFSKIASLFPEPFWRRLRVSSDQVRVVSWTPSEDKRSGKTYLWIDPDLPEKTKELLQRACRYCAQAAYCRYEGARRSHLVDSKRSICRSLLRPDLGFLQQRNAGEWLSAQNVSIEIELKIHRLLFDYEHALWCAADSTPADALYRKRKLLEAEDLKRKITEQTPILTLEAEALQREADKMLEDLLKGETSS